MNDNKSKKVILPTVIATLVLIVMVVGATYAYINVNATDNFDTKTISASVQEMGSVAITGYDLTMNLSRTQVFTPESDKTFYLQEGSNEASESSASPKIATVTVTGEGTYTCDYTISVTATGELFTNAVSIGEDLLVLTVNSSTNFKHDFNTAWGNDAKTITGTLTDLTKDKQGEITAQLKYVNSKETDQSALAGKNGTLTFDVTTFNCKPTA